MATPLLVLVPGILHTPAHFEPFQKVLRDKGYEAVCVALPNIGDGAIDAAPWDDARAVRRALEQSIVADGRDVVLICHSYGGIPGCQAVLGLERSQRQSEGKSGGITQLIFLNAFIVSEGESALDILDLVGQSAPPWIELDPSSEKIHKPNDLAAEYLFDDLDEPARSMWAGHGVDNLFRSDCGGRVPNAFSNPRSVIREHGDMR